MLQVLTANRLGAGDVVYWSAAHGWVETLAGADALDDAAGEAALARAAGAVKRREVVNPYLFDVREKSGALVPVKERELIRARGPTVRTDLGKQAEPANV